MQRLYTNTRELWWNRDRRRHIAAMRRMEVQSLRAQCDRTQAMAAQLAEIWALPEIHAPQR